MRKTFPVASYSTSVESPKPVEEAFDYMADFRNAEEWDENTSSVKLTSGQAGQASSEYEVITGFAGRDMKLSYRTVEVDRPSKVVFESSTGMAKIRDTIEFSGDEKGCEVKYDARILTNGLAKVIDPLFSLIFKRVGDRAAASLRKALGAR